MEFIMDLVVSFVGGHPAFSTIIFAMGILRAVFKPLQLLVHAFVDATETKADNEAIAAFEKSKIYEGLVWFIDYFASIKVPKK